MTDPSEGRQDRLAPWWVLVLGGVALVAVGIGAILAYSYSYWGWDGRVEGAAVVSPPLGLFFIVWGIGRGARSAVHHLRHRAEPAPSPAPERAS
ncbi:hypothetical protein [Frigoribacterium salinisoli]